MGIVFVPPVPAAGRKHLLSGRNGAITSGPAMAGFAGMVNMLTGRRKKMLFAKVKPGYAGVTAGTLMRCRFFTSRHATSVTVLMILAKSNGVGGAYFWTVDGVSQGSKSVGAQAAAPAGPSDVFTATHTFRTGGGANLTGGALHEARLDTSGTVRVLGAIIFEQQAGILSTTDYGIPVDAYDVGAPVTGASLNAIIEQLWVLYKESGAHQIFWSDDTAGAAAPTAVATYKNILDASTAGWAAGAAGFWTYPYRKHRLTGTTVDVTLWCYASATTGSVRFSNSAGVIGTITGIAAAGFYSATATLDATLTSDLVIVEHKDTAGTITTQSAGMYELTV